jgi:hypothetical protein
MSDRYGTRLVDEVNNIILVKDGDTWREPKSEITTEDYPVMYCETKTGKSDGFEIPITLCLGKNANEGVGFNYSEAHMTQLGADDEALLYLRNAWVRYREIMNHPDITYQEYLDLLRKGEGNIRMLDSDSEELTLVDPRRGFSAVITGDEVSDMPVRFYNSLGFYFTSDEKGRLLFSTDSASFYNEYSDNVWFMFNSVGSIFWLSILKDYCMKDHIEKTCGQIRPEIEKYCPEIVDDVNNYYLGLSEDPLFTLR